MCLVSTRLKLVEIQQIQHRKQHGGESDHAKLQCGTLSVY